MMGPGPATTKRRSGARSVRTCVVVAAFVLTGCSGDRRPPPLPLLSHPLSVAGPRASGAASAVPVASKPPFGLEAFTPLLAAPELRTASDALEAGDEARAAREVEACMARRPPAPDEVQSHQLLLGRLREAAGDRVGAAASYELAAGAKGLLGGYAALGAGRVLVQGGRAKDAVEWLGRVPAGQPIAEDAALLRAEVAYQSGDAATAIDVWRAYLGSKDAPPDPALALRFAEALLVRAAAAGRPPGDVDADAGEALSQVRRVLSRSSEATTSARAQALEARSLALLSPAVRAKRAQPSPEEDLERLRTLVEDRQHEAAAPLGERLLMRLGEAERWHQAGCEATVLRARALAGMKEWTAAEESLGAAVRHCTDPDLRARALYLAGKYATSTKRYVEAAQYYEKVETECPAHRLAVDARLHRALC
jgi:tetratricopeptide (TPR) repeat protein